MQKAKGWAENKILLKQLHIDPNRAAADVCMGMCVCVFLPTAEISFSLPWNVCLFLQSTKD